MKRLIIICFFVSYLNNISAKYEITIYPQKEDIVIDSGTDLTLGCIGKEPIDWTFSNNSGSTPSMNDSTVVNKQTKSARNTDNYESILTVFNVSLCNIGHYYCHGKTVNTKTSTRSSGIYVYIRDEKLLTIHPNSEKVNILPTSNDLVVLDCIPTAPDVNVTLLYIAHHPIAELVKGDKFKTEVEKRNVVIGQVYINDKVSINKYPADEIVQSYSPYTGFVVMQKYSQLTYSCFFERDNLLQRTFYGIGVDRITQWKPYIVGPNTNLIISELGDNLILNCTTIVARNSTLEWIYPKSIDFHRISITNFAPVKVQKWYELLVSTIQVNNVTLEDEGEYHCKQVTYLVSRLTSTTTKYVAVIDKKLKPNPPKAIYPKEKQTQGRHADVTEFEVNVDENITLTCESSEPVTWDYPTYYKTFLKVYASNTNPKIKDNNELKHKKESKNGSTIYKTILYLNSVHHANTGFYHCYENKTSKTNPYKSQIFYMFVRDPDNLQAREILIPVTIDYWKNFNARIPCRPSSADVEVSLKLGNRTKISADFDPYYGFTINMTLFDSDIDMYCIFEMDGNKETSKFTFLYTDYFTYEAYTFIDFHSPEDHSVNIGDELNLYCRTVVSNNNFNTPDWLIPNRNRSDYSIAISTVPIKGGNVLTSKLIIKNVQKEDEGLYFCYYPNLDDNLRSYSLYITVNDAFEVTPYVDGLEHNRTYFGADMILFCNVQVDHNSNFSINWSVPYMNNYENENSISTDLELIPNLYGINGKGILRIKNVTFENEGNYTCNALDSSNHIKSAVLDVVVENTTKPEIIESNMNGTVIYTTLGQSLELTCFATGIPVPRIIWKKDETVISQENNTLILPFLTPNDTGLYTCNTSNHLGWDIRKVTLNVPTESDALDLQIVIIFIVLILVVFSILIIIQRKRQLAIRKKLIEAGIINFETGEIQNLNPKINLSDQSLLLPYDRKWDIPRERIKLGNELGSGNFGVVFQAEVFGIFRGETIKTVAVKMARQNTNIMYLKALISELKLMTHIGKHLNIVNLLGACTEQITTRQLMVIVEYCKYGNIRNYLLQNRENFVDLINSESGLIVNISEDKSLIDMEQSDCKELTTLCLVCWSFQISRGMEYLASRKILHGDLAARNVLLAEENVVKISDFGLSKNMRNCLFYKKKNNKCPMPVKWMSIEAIRDGIFSTQSDVWSFGVVLWELFSLGRTPYPELETNFNFFRKISDGYRMEKPQYSTKEIYEVMLECWNSKPESRPSFTDLVEKFRGFLQENIYVHYKELNAPYENENQTPDYFSVISSSNNLTMISNNNEERTKSTGPPIHLAIVSEI